MGCLDRAEVVVPVTGINRTSNASAASSHLRQHPVRDRGVEPFQNEPRAGEACVVLFAGLRHSFETFLGLAAQQVDPGKSNGRGREFSSSFAEQSIDFPRPFPPLPNR